MIRTPTTFRERRIRMTAKDLPYLPLTELSRRLGAGETSSHAIVAACLERIAALDEHTHAFIEVYREAALDCATAADLERKAGLVRGPLHGLPIALKDLLHIKDRVTTAGSKSWHGRVATETATAVERLLAAGMIPLGKTHMVEFAFGGWGRNQPMGAPWNPWDTRVHRVAGGSSSGSAVAVAAGLAPAAIGSDTGGSIRIPAALCGLTGLKPTY
jgi:aspartyl-tRNA(Asn)/glutamyl-tRNA(Gln) amidotransferase subunit A